ncbi:amino acid adenylation domain-containing protein/non-ribosomal peptide synthase protein (TIGR01720 family) [Paenibacillus sp. DS2015]|uniref:amino acid adenylation domain-containing protein n=1 Tax=Paenibacillus sp. DS2015 TaxID=3373917 RepID=UPI003D20C5BC
MAKIDKNNIEDIVSLSPMQEGMLFHYLHNPASNAYFEQLTVQLQGEVNTALFREVWQQITDTNSALRTVFRWERLEKPVQMIKKSNIVDFRYIDLTSLQEKEKEFEWERIQQEDVQESHSLLEVSFRIRLVSFRTDLHEMMISYHHILYDGWSNGILLKELFQLYNKRNEGGIGELQRKTPYKEYIKWLQSGDKAKHRQYWKEQLADLESKTVLPGIMRRQDRPTAGQQHSITLSETLHEQINNYVSKHKVSLASFFYSMWAICLQAYNTGDDVVFGTTVSGRDVKIKQIETMVGLFINTVPLRVQRCDEDSSLALNLKVDRLLKERGGFDAASLTDIMQYGEVGHLHPLFDSIVVIENYPLDLKLFREIKGLQPIGFSVKERTNYGLTLAVVPHDQIEVHFQYDETILSPETIRYIAEHVRNVVQQAVDTPMKKICELDLLSPQERQCLIVEFNAARQTYPKHQTIYGLFEEQAERTPERTAVVCGNRHLSYQVLNERANQLAYVLRARGVQANTVVGLMTERSLEMLVGLLAIVKAGGAYLPINPHDPIERIQFMLGDSQALLIMTQSHLIDTVPCEWEMEVLLIDDEALAQQSGTNLEPINAAQDLAYIIYTSGSTGQPKGVLIEHAQVMNMVAGSQREIFANTTEQLQIALLFSYVFDASMEQIGNSLLFGHTLHILSETCIEDPEMFMAYIRDRGIDACGGTPSHLAFLTAQERAGAQNANGEEPAATSRLKHLIVGGESLSRHIVQALWQAFPEPDLKIWNAYGPTETCVVATYHSINRTDFQLEQRQQEAMIDQVGRAEHERELLELSIPIGRPLPHVNCYIVGANNQLQPFGVAGELCIGGEGLARGYLNQPELTAFKFVANPFVLGERMYRTGDLARWLPGGILMYMGRIDQQVKIRGYRIETGEIEAKLLSHPQVKESAVIAFDEGNGQKALCAYVVSQGQEPLNVAEIRTYLARYLPEYMVPSAFISMERLPLTPNGKLNRKALPTPQERWSGSTTFVAPRDKREEALAQIWQDILRVERIGIYDNFFELGGHSLKAMSLAARIHKELNIEVPLHDLFVHPTLEAMAGHMGRLESSAYSPIEVVREQAYYPVSSAQKRLFVLEQLEQLHTSYNMSGVFRLSGVWDKTKFTLAFNQLIQRHDALRTSFVIVDGEPVQLVLPSVPFEIEEIAMDSMELELNSKQEVIGLSGASGRFAVDNDNDGPMMSAAKRERTIQAYIARFIRPFDLSQAPLIRVGLIYDSGEEAILLVDMHHIISDGVSMDLFVREWVKLYREEELPPLSIQYKDYAAWQHQQLQGERMKQQEAYWLRQLGGELPVLNMPTDYLRPALQSFEGDRVRLDLGQTLTGELKQLCTREGVTLTMVLLAAYQVLLSKYSSQEDVIVGIPIAGRSHADLGGVMGMFVNTLAIRSRPDGDKTFLAFLQEVKEQALQAYEHQDYPFEQVVEQLHLPRDLSRNPVFDVLFVMQNTREGDMLQEISDLNISKYPFQNRMSKFDLSLQATEMENIELELEYATQLFAPATAQRIIQHYSQLLEQIVKSPKRKLLELELLSSKERQQLLVQFNDTTVDYPREQTIHGLFEEQAERTPDRVAVVLEEERLTYRELNERANRLARILRSKGVEADTIVGIMTERSLGMILGIIAILKAGGAYVPIDPEYPQERIQYMLEDTGTRHLVTSLSDHESLHFAGAIFDLNAPELYAVDEADVKNAPPSRQSNNLAYIIYTSGTTGKPKGVLVEHQGVVNALWWRKQQYELNEKNVLQLFSYSFDGFVTSLFTPLISGATVILLSEDSAKDPVQIRKAIISYQIHHFICVPSLYAAVLECLTEDEARFIQKVTLAGEKASAELIRLTKQLNARLELINEYGPTENSVVTSFLRNMKDTAGAIIGKPIHNTQLYIMNDKLQLQAVGIPGELCISGDGLARGYLNRPDLTAEKFINHPFIAGERLYRTGDLARWVADGSVEYLGRMDHQVKIRGFRIELGEIESRLLQHEHIQKAVVMAQEEKLGQPVLCAYYVAIQTAELSIAKLRSFVSEQLPNYMIPSYFIPLEQFPLTSNGKIDRQALPLPDGKLHTGTEYVAPRNRIEETLINVWSEVLGVQKLGIRDNFFELSGDSIKAIQVATRLSSYELTFEMKDLFSNPTIEMLSDYVKTKDNKLVEQGLVNGPVLLTPIQEWFFQGYKEEPFHFNQAVMLQHPEGIDPVKLSLVFERIVLHHDALRMRYRRVEGQVEQVYWNEGEGELYTLDVIDLREESDVETLILHNAERLQRSIQLEKGPLVKLGLFQTQAGDHLLIVIHHLVVDGVSWRIVLEDLTRGYEQLNRGVQITFPAKTDSFQTWSSNLKAYAAGKSLKMEAKYWEEADHSIAPALPKDHHVERRILFDQRTQAITWSIETTDQLLRKSHRAFHTEINDLLLTSLAIAIQRWAGHSQISLHVEGHGREEVLVGVDINRTVGWFTSQYPVHLTARENESLSATIKQIKETLRKVPNKGIGYGILKYIGNYFESDRQPEILFNYLGQVDQDIERNMFAASPIPVGETVSPLAPMLYALDVSAIVTSGQLTMDLKYNGHEYEDATIQKLSKYIEQSLQEVVIHCVDKEIAEHTPSDYGLRRVNIVELEHIENLVGRFNIQAIYSLTPMQQGMLFHSIMDPDSAAYFQQNIVKLRGRIDEVVLEQSLNLLIDRYDILRTQFVFDRMKEFVQVVRKENTRQMKLIDVRRFNDQDKTDRIKAFIKADLDTGFNVADTNLLKITLIRTEDDASQLIWSFHHMLMDGWCTSILMREFLAIYHSLVSGSPLQLQPVIPYGNYINWLEDQDRDEAMSYWDEYLQEYEQQVTLPRKISSSDADYIQQQSSFQLEQAVTEQLQRMAASNQVTLYTVLQTIWGIVLQKYNQTSDVVFGSVVSGRPAEIKGIETMVGLFINTIPVRIQSRPDMTFTELLKEVQEQALESGRNDYYPLADIQALTMLKQNLIHHIVAYENYPIEAELMKAVPGRDSEISVEDVEVFEQTHFDLVVKIIPGEQLEIRFEYNANVYEADTINRIGEHVKNIIRQVLEQSSGTIQELQLITEAERKQLLQFNRMRHVSYPKQKIIHEIFEEQATRTPYHTAVVYEAEQLTYRELNEKANQLARVLRDQGVTSDSIVGIIVDRSMEMIIGLLAILKAGGAYAPIDTEYPEERVRFMLQDSQCSILLTQGEDIKYAAFTGKMINISDARLYRGDVSNLALVNKSSDLAYVIYTSGSTGTPKGVMIEHHNVIRLLHNDQFQFDFSGRDVWTMFHSYCFDFSVWEMYGALLYGGKLVVVPKSTAQNPSAYVRLLKEQQVTVVNQTPTAFYQLIGADAVEDHDLKVKYVIFGGEALKPALLQKWRNKYPETKLINMYGITETTVHVTYKEIREQEIASNQSNIGSPIPTLAAYILDDQQHEVPIGVGGELYISGNGLARGYLNRPELTAEKFIDDPNSPGERMYRTGDLARWLPDGSMEYFGRMDHQVKIRGFRIELGEIESRLLQHDCIQEAIVVAREENPGQPGGLYAYYVASDPAELTISGLRSFISEQLPNYMIPSYFIQLEQFPITSNGKIDRKALPLPDGSLHTETEYAAPTNEIEEALVHVWSEVLGVQSIGIRDNFFELGGDSIKAIQVASRLSSYEFTFEMKDLFSNPTIETLSTYVKAKDYQPVEQGPVTGNVPLTPIQDWFFQGYKEEPFHYNQAVMLHHPEGIDVEKLSAVFERIVLHHDALRMRYRMVEGQVEQAYRNVGEGQLYTLDIIDLSDESEFETRILHDAERIQRSIHLDNGPLVKLGLFQTQGGDHLLVVIHHLVVDGVSWRIVLEDLTQGYEQLGRGEQITFPAKTDSYRTWSNNLRAYAAGNMLKKEVKYWEEAMQSAAPVLPKDHWIERRFLADQRKKSVTWNAELTDQLLKKSHRAYRTEINDLLLASLAIAIQRWTGLSQISLHVEGHGREEVLERVDINRTVGWFTSLYPVNLVAHDNESLSVTLKQVKETLRRVPNKGIGYGILKYIGNHFGSDRQPEILFNYLGQMDQDIERNTFAASSISVGETVSPLAAMFYALDVSAIVASGQLTMELKYNSYEYDDATMQRLVVYMEQSLQEVVIHCVGKEDAELTPSDYGIQMDLDELELLLEE